MRVWDLATERLLYSYAGFQHGEYLTWTPDGYFMGSDKAIRSYCHIVKGNKTYGMDQFFEQFYNPAIVQARAMGLQVDGKNLDEVLTASPPPEVEILSPQPGPNGVVAASGERVQMRVAARDTGGGVREIRVFHNGKRVGAGAWTGVAEFQLTGTGGDCGPGHHEHGVRGGHGDTGRHAGGTHPSRAGRTGRQDGDLRHPTVERRKRDPGVGVVTRNGRERSAEHHDHAPGGRHQAEAAHPNDRRQ